MSLLLNTPDLEISILPINIARPGFETTYKIRYYNKGTTSLSGEINLYFESEFMELLSATPTEDGSTTNNLKWLYNDLRPFEWGEIKVKM